MKKNFYSIKKPKWGLIALMMFFCCLFGNTAMAQTASANNDTFVWTGITSSAWNDATNWYVVRGTTTAGTNTYPGEVGLIDIVYINKNNCPNAPILDAQTRTITRLFVNNNYGTEAGATLLINSGATLNIAGSGTNNLVLAGGSVINNGALSINTTGVGFTSFPVYGINCSNPTNLPTVPTEYGYSGTGTLSITLSAANFANSAAIAATGNSSTTTTATNGVNATYRIVVNNPTITLNQASTNTIYAIKTAGGNNANKLIVGGTGLTVGTVGTPSIGGLIGLGPNSTLTVDTGTTLTLNSASTNTVIAISLFSSGSVAQNTYFTNNGTINILGASTKSGLNFSASTVSGNVACILYMSNTGTLNVNLNSSGIGTAALSLSNGGGSTANTGTAVNIANTGTISLKNTSTTLGTGYSIFCTTADQAPKMAITNNGTLNLEGTVYSFGYKTTITNNGTLNSNSDLKSFTAGENASGATINYVKTASSDTARYVGFTSTSALSNASTTYSLTVGSTTFTFFVIHQKYNFAGANTLFTSLITSGNDVSLIPTTGTLTKVSGTGDATITYTAVNIPTLNGGLPITTNAGTINTFNGTAITSISSLATTGGTSGSSTIAPGGDTGYGIVDFNYPSPVTLNGTIKLNIQGTTGGVNYDKIQNSAVYGQLSIGETKLDVTGIYTPTVDPTVIDILTVGQDNPDTPIVSTTDPDTGITTTTGNETGWLYPSGTTGGFKQVTGILPGSGWSVSFAYDAAATHKGGKAQLVWNFPYPPTITKLSRDGGTSTSTQGCGGSTLTIIGAHFVGTPIVTLNGVAFTEVTVVSETQIDVILPSLATSGLITVTTTNGTVTSASNFAVVETSTVVTAVSACTSYTWANNGQTYTESGTYLGTTTNCVTQQLNLIIFNTNSTTTTVSVCGSSYQWPSNGVTYTASGSYPIAVGCNSETLNLTLTAPSTNSTTISSNLTYTWTNNGQTYTESGTYTGTTTNCVTEQLNLTITHDEMLISPATYCVGATVGSVTAGTSLKFYKDDKPTTGAYLGSQKLASGTTYYVTQTPALGSESSRSAIVVILTALVAPTAVSTTEAKVICKYIGTSNPVTFTATATGATSYTWTKPAGASFVGDATGASVQINFLGVTPSVIGAIGAVSVDAKNNLGCPSGKPKVLALTTKAPSAAKAIAFTYGATVIKKAGNFVGDASKILTLKATDISGTADHHVWTLPEGTTVVSGDEDKDLELTIHLGNVAAANTPLVFSVASVGGCGSSSKSLSVTRAESGTPKGLVLTDATLADANAIPAVLPIVLKKLDGYTGSLKTRTLTLTATPNLTSGSEATSYKWVLPQAATIVDDSATPVDGELNTYTSSSNTISINLANVGLEAAFLFKVYGVNGNGISLASKDLACTSASPKAPAAIYAGTDTSVTGIKFLAYNPSCNTVTISVPEVFGVNNTLAVVAASSGNTVFFTHTEGSNTATIDLSTAGGSLLAKSTITIRATAYTATGTIFKDYIVKFGSACSAPIRIAPEGAHATEKFSVVAYPNPSMEGFRVKSSNGKSFGVQVYDMLGRSIEQRQMSSDAQIGSNYASGVYNVIVNQGANVKTLRMIKQ